MGHGVLCVMMAGMEMMLVLCADNLATMDMSHCTIIITTLGEELVIWLVKQATNTNQIDNSVCRIMYKYVH